MDSRAEVSPFFACSGSAAMYNRYIPQEGYAPVNRRRSPGASPPAAAGTPPPSPFSPPCWEWWGQERWRGGRKSSGLSGILDRLGLGKLDRGDILLLLVLIYLFRETDDDEWLIILALVLLMGL